MGRPLTNRTRLLIDLIEDSGIQAEMMALFENDGALYGPPTVEVLERVRFSVIKLAMRGPRSFQVAVELFRIDTRDLLVEAEFADDPMAHEDWCESMLTADPSRLKRHPDLSEPT